jgi:lysozyme
MKCSDSGIEFLKKEEGVRLQAYQDSIGVWTVGVGHTGKEVGAGMTITEDETDALLRADLETAEKCVNNCVAVPLTQNQFDALCSFVFNLGCASLRNSTLLKKLNSSDDEGASEEFKKWNHAGGRVLVGLTKRRMAESELFQTA